LKKLNKWLIRLLQGLISLLEKSVKEYTPKTHQEDKMPTRKPTEVKGVNLLLIRDTFSENSTMGELFLNGERMCDTLELPYKDNQRSISCIPSGEYKVRMRYPRESATREYLHLLIKEVPNRDYILFHRGNTAKDTRGCILVGLGSQQDIVHNSTLAMDLLLKEIINLGGRNINLIIKNK
jgi:hypothetical protein|tara:strand:+ start:195 stop:734 length:540 start_codon:yes stop_codon:yes gene_type:complete